MSEPELYNLPQSCMLLGALVKAINSYDDNISRRTTKRFFSGETIDQYSENRILKAVSKALIASGLIPAPTSYKDNPERYDKSIADILTEYTIEWDNMRAYLHHRWARTTRPDLMNLTVLRLGIVFLAIRTAAAINLSNLPIPQESTPIWAQEKGGRKLLKSYLDKYSITKEQFLEGLGTDKNTLDGWLYNDTRPLDDKIHLIAKKLASYNKDSYQNIRNQFRRYYILVALCDTLAKSVEREKVIELATEFIGIVRRLYAEFEEALQNSSEKEKVAVYLQIFLLGPRLQIVLNALSKVSEQEADPEWKIDILAGGGNWESRLQQVALKFSINNAAGVAKSLSDMKGIPVSDSRGALNPLNSQNQTRASLWKSPEVIVDLAHLDFERFISKIEEELSDLRTAVKNKPQNAECHFELGSRLGKMGENFNIPAMVEEGVRECRIASQLEPLWDTPRVEIGIIYLNTHHYSAALKELEAAASLYKEVSLHLAFNLGVARLKNNNLVGALEMLDKVIAAEPNHAHAVNYAAYSRFLIGDHKAGVDLAKRAMKLGVPDTFNAWRKGVFKKSLS